MADDFLLELAKNPQARKLIKSLGLPIPMPTDLRRAKGPRTERPLKDRDVAVYIPSGSALLGALATGLIEAGANPFVVETPGTLQAFAGPGEAYGRRAVELDPTADRKYHAAVLDGTGIDSVEGLKIAYEFLHPLMRKLKTCGRIVVLGRPPESCETTAAAASQAALEGFVRSAAKEVGKKGTSALLLRVEPGAEGAIAGPLRFLLSERSAYVSGQPLTVSTVAGAVADSADWVCPIERKVALVTGAARGIGAATARVLADEGATVVCLDRPADDGPTARLAREINGDILLQDITDEDAPQKIAEYLMEKHGGVDIVVHNAGITRDRTLANMKAQSWNQTLDVNLGAVLRITSDLLASGVLRDNGRLICLSSIAGIAGNVGQTNYAASKAGIIGLVEHLAPLAGRRGITVNAIAPGFIETRLTAAIPFAIREVARRMNNLGQGGRPVDIAETIAFLATPTAQGITGQTLRVCGGSMVGR